MIDETLTMIPGPTPVHPRILAALARPTVSHVAPAFVKEFREALDAFRGLCQSASGQPFVVSGAGTLAMEMALVNVVAPGEKILVISHGYFGDRYADLAGAFGISCDVLRSEWGRAVPPEELARKRAEGKYAAVTITHVDTSTGTASPVEDYVRLLRGRDELVILDGVCATGGIDEPFDRWGIDVLLTAAQKAIGAPPGLALCLFSKRAMERRRSRASVPAYYADINRWLAVMEDPGRYYSTPCVNEIVALGEALRIVHEEGLPARFARHHPIASATWETSASARRRPCSRRSRRACARSAWRRLRARRSRRPRVTSRRWRSCRLRTHNGHATASDPSVSARAAAGCA